MYYFFTNIIQLCNITLSQTRQAEQQFARYQFLPMEFQNNHLSNSSQRGTDYTCKSIHIFK